MTDAQATVYGRELVEVIPEAVILSILQAHAARETCQIALNMHVGTIGSVDVKYHHKFPPDNGGKG